MHQGQLLERGHKLHDAKEHYERGIELMLEAIRMERDTDSKKWMSQQVHQWLQHAEQVKAAITSAQSRRGPARTTPSTLPPAPAPAPRAAPRDTPRSGDDPIGAQIEQEIMESCASQRFDDVVGLENAKEALREAVVFPALRPDLYSGLRSAPKGLLVFGPPGNGKTMLARALANESNATFFAISASSLTSKWVGESEKLVRALFEMARERAPSVIFFDEIDALLSSGASNESSRRLLTQFLIEFDGVKSDAESSVFVMGATNRPEALDEGVRRRLTKRIYIPLPCIRARLALITSLLGGVKHQLTESDCERVARVLEGYSGSDITAVVKDAAMEPLRELPTESIRRTRDQDIRAIKVEDLLRSASAMRASSSTKELERYELWNAQFGDAVQSSTARGVNAVSASIRSTPQPGGMQHPADSAQFPVMRPKPGNGSSQLVKSKGSCTIS